MRTRSKSIPWQWVVLFAAIAFFVTQFIYFDCMAILRASVNIWHALFDGIPMNFYQYNRFAENIALFPSVPPTVASYPYLAYIPSAIWVFPLYLLERFAGVDLFANAWAVIYLKIGLILLSVCSAFLLRRILTELDARQEVADAAPLLYLSSSLFFTGTVAVGQLEAITVLFMLLGYRAFYRRNTVGFICFFAAAIPFKYFAVFAFVPLLLLYEKKPLKIVRNGILAVLPTLAVYLLTLNDLEQRVGLLTGHTGTVHTENYFIQAWFPESSLLPVGNGTINLLIIALLVLCLYCCFTKPEGTKQTALYGAYVGFLAFLILIFAPSKVHPYWTVLLVPFSVLLLGLQEKEIARNLLIETFAASVLTIWHEIEYHHCFDMTTIQYNVFLLGKTIPAGAEVIGLQSVFGIISKAAGMPMKMVTVAALYSAALVGFACLAYMLSPRKTAQSLANDAALHLRGIIWTRIALSSLILAMPLVIAYVKLYMLK